MSEPPNARYEVLQPVDVGRGTLWVRVGRAERQPDGTIDATFEADVEGRRFRLAAMAAPDEEKTLPGSRRRLA